MNITILDEVKQDMEKTIESLEKRFASVRAGRANPSSLDGVMVKYYGNLTSLKQLATISVPEATQMVIKPFDKSCLSDIEKAIFEADLGYTPNNDGESIRIVVPPLTEERRRELVKQVKKIAEDSKVSIRNNRHEAITKIEKSELPQDEEKLLESKVQELVTSYNKKVEDLSKAKEKELLTV